MSLDVLVDRASSVPLYHQIARQLEAAIFDGRLAKGSFLGNEIELADAWRISRPTVRQAMQELVDAGLLVRRRGIGTQVVSDEIRRPARLSSLHDALASQGHIPTTLVLRHERVIADAAVTGALELEPGTEVVHLERCRVADGRRLAILRNWVIVDAAGDIAGDELTEHGFYELLRRRGVRPHSAVQRFGAVNASAADAGLLDLPTGTALLTVRRVMRDESGRPVELGNHVYDATRYSIEMNVLDN